MLHDFENPIQPAKLQFSGFDLLILFVPWNIGTVSETPTKEYRNPVYIFLTKHYFPTIL